MVYSQRIAADFCQPFCPPLNSIQGAVYPAFGMEYSQQIGLIFASLPALPCFLFIYMKGAVRHFRMRAVKARFLSVPHPGIIF